MALKNAAPGTSAAESVAEKPADDGSSDDDADFQFSFTKALQSFSGKAKVKSKAAPKISTPQKSKSAVGTTLNQSAVGTALN